MCRLFGQFVIKKRQARWGLGVIALFFIAWPLIARAAAEGLIAERNIGNAELIVVLGGAATYRERTHLAAKLFFEGRAPRILLTNDGMPAGWSSEHRRTLFFSERAFAELSGMGVPPERIEVLAPVVTSTYDEAVELRDYAAGQRIQSLLVVTSAYHSRRAEWTWRHVLQGSGVSFGLELVAPGEQLPAPATWWLSRVGWEMVAGEYCKMAYYLFVYR
jgi:uncharacterized SAM-binding protein YcdF (DUF218 family)